jgi:uncharacterized membrane protein
LRDTEGREETRVLLADYDGFFSRVGLSQWGFRWLHILAGITWIGLLYYFNFVQTPAFTKFEDDPHKEIGGKARSIALDKIARRALWWFRWSALFTALTGILIAVYTEDYFSNEFGKRSGGIAISTGMLLGIIMLLNVWGVIWRNQKIVLANAANTLAGGAADPNAAAAGRRSGMASRQNTIFSVSMLYFMVFKGHAPYQFDLLGAGKVATYWIIALVIIAVLELNALGMMPWKFETNKGLNKLYDGGVRYALFAAFGLWVVFLILSETLLRN